VRSPVDLVATGILKYIKRGRWRLVFESHSTQISSSRFKTKLLIPLVRFALSQTNLVIAVSTAVAEGSQCKGAKKIEVHFQGANVVLKQDRGRKLIFLFVGRLIDLKQPLFFLQAVRGVRHLFAAYDARVKIVGQGPCKSVIAEFIESNQLQDIVELTGYSQDLDSIYSESEFLVSTSRFEGLPLTFFEAKQHGLRIITTPSSGDFDILGSEDVILADFQESSLLAALDQAVRFGLSTSEERRSIQEKNQWMQSKTCALKYYDLVNSELESQS
jgi:glycosyltransferase involved in cell wall biosynthesis